MTRISDTFAEALNAKFGEKYSVSVDHGTVYDKIVIEHTSPTINDRGVHAFVVIKTGDVVKAAGWAAPQRGKNGLAIRYNLATDEGFTSAIEAADAYGDYLYKK